MRPQVNPQPESYLGCVNSIGIRSSHLEGKSIDVTLCFVSSHRHGNEICVARTIRTYGPQMLPAGDSLQRQPVIALVH